MPGSAERAAPRRMVRVDGQRLKFAAAHMAMLGEGMEPLHGHNYSVMIEADGELGAPGWVIDFGELKRIGREICDRLDHHFLLQCTSPTLGMQRSEGAWKIWCNEKQYRFPVEDVFELPIRNTTAELIAEWFWGEVRLALANEDMSAISHVAVGVEEAPGQAGWFSASVLAPQ